MTHQSHPEYQDTSLLPCPFCDGEASLSVLTKGSMPHHYIECLECAASSECSDMPISKGRNESFWNAREKWNSRKELEGVI